MANNNDQKQCTKCPNNCQRCIGVNNTADCTECDTGYYLAQTELIYVFVPIVIQKKQKELEMEIKIMNILVVMGNAKLDL